MVGPNERWATSVVLASGETAYIRPITPGDAPLLLAFHERQPSENRYRRFFSPKPSLTEAELRRFTTVDFRDRVALVMEVHGEFAAWASYERWRGRDDAEVAFMVDDAHQRQGIATLLLEHLAAVAQHNGIARFTAEVLADNRAMLGVFARAGWPVQRRFESGVVELAFPLGSNATFVESVEEREHRADSRAVARLLLPRSIAVIGASDRPGSVGWEVWRNARRGFDGPLYAVNPAHAIVDGCRSYPSVSDIEDDVWLAVIAVPANILAEVVDQCLARRVRGAVILTAVDTSSVEIEALVQRARRYGMRIIGPASMGVAMGRGPGVSGVQPTLAPVELPAGGVAISLQSGSLGASVLQLASRLSMGVSWFVSLGDKSDVSGNDLLQFWEDDENTTVIAMYTETFGNPRKFARLARRVSRRRPIVTVRTGPAAASIGADALYEQAGLIQVPTVRDLLDTARVLATQPVPRGPRVAVLTNSRSPGVLADAALVAEGLTVVAAPHPLSWRSADADYATALRAALDDDTIDAVLVIHAPPVLAASTPAGVIDTVVGDTASADVPKPVLAVLLGHDDGPILPGSPVASFAFPEQAAAVLGHMYRYRRWLESEAAEIPAPPVDVDSTAVTAIIEDALLRGRRTLPWEAAQRVLEAYGISIAPGIEVEPADDRSVIATADHLGYPVAVKAMVRGIGRSAEAGIALDLANAAAVAEAMSVMRTNRGRDADHVLVQKMVHPGVEIRAHCTTDDQMGPVLTVGLGGASAEAIGDHVGRLPPLSAAGADRLIHATRAGAALTAAGIALDDLANTLVRIGQLMTDHPEIKELDANPLVVGRDGCAVTDLTIVVAPANSSPDAMRRLT